MVIEEKSDRIKVKLGSESTKKIFNQLEKAIQLSRETGKPVEIYPYESQWERWGTPKYLLKAFKYAPEVSKLEPKSGESKLEMFKQSLCEMGFNEEEIDSYLDTIYVIGAIQTIGANYTNEKGYPEENLEKALSIDRYDATIDQLKQLNVIDNAKKWGYELSPKGEEILGEYCQNNYFGILDREIEEIIEEVIPIKLLYTYLHLDSLDSFEVSEWRWGKSRTSEIGKPRHTCKEIHGLLRSIVDTNSEDSSDSEKFDPFIGQENDPIMKRIRRFWDHLEKSDLAVIAPVVTFTNSSSCKYIDKKTRCMPPYISNRLFELIQEKLSNDKKVLDILMMINTNKDSPKAVKNNIRSGDKTYDLSKEDLSMLENVINLLAERGITSKWSSSGEVPYIIKNYEQFLEFSKDYLLGKEELELEE